MHFNRKRLSAFGFAVFAAAAFGVSIASAQFGPPSTLYGSITDAGGTVPAGQVVEAYIGDRVCGRGATQFTGDGAARVTVYYADVVSREQTAGCGAEGSEVRIKVGDRFAPQTTRWRQGPVEHNLVFGNATPAPIPTFTPAPTRTPAPSTGTPVPGSTAAPTGQAGTPTTAASTPEASATATPTLAGALTSNTPPPGASSGSGGGDDGGFPVWGIVGIIGVVVAAAGGGVGVMMARSRRANATASDDAFVQGP